MDEKETLHRYLRVRRDDLLGKLDGVGEYDARRPLTCTGTILLGLVNHAASVELGYFSDVFGRPSGRSLPWLDDDASHDADMWATADESREAIIELHRFAAAHSDATITALRTQPGGMGRPPCRRRCCGEAGMRTPDVPAQIGALPTVGRPANSALLQAGITSLAEAASLGGRKLLAMHGIGSKAVWIKAAAAERRLTFAA
jgi:Protein of unknown function (DUF664)